MRKDISKISSPVDLDNLSINTIRFLAIDAIQKSNSGHPGLPMGAAAFAYVLWTRFLKHNPANPKWFDRDRFVLSAGHGSMLLYSLLHLTGYDLSLDQIKQFRQWGSQAPGHPERGLTPGVEVTTGPLGQGFGNGVGMAMAEAFLAARYNRPGHKIIDHTTYGLVSDGDLMEGVAAESASLAGHLRLGKLICLYDNNHVTLSAATDLTFTEDVKKRFSSYGWHTQSVEEGNNLVAIEQAIETAQRNKEKPSLILVHTHLGYGAPHKQDTFEAHGSPLGEEEVKLTKENLGWPLEPSFYIPDAALTHFREAVERGRQIETKWERRFSAYEQSFPDLAQELHQMMRGELPAGWDADIPEFPPAPKGMATRVASGKVMNAIASKLPTFIGGSADLDPSTHTALVGEGDFESPQEPVDDPQGSVGGGWRYSGSNLHFGIREHGMGAILNGMAAHGGTIPFGATFLIFSDYMRPPIRLAALMGLRVIYVFTHDSIALGEDGPTHQPVEQLLGLRSIPNMLVIRPADANETAAAWRIAIEHQDGPVALVLTRQNLPILDLHTYPHLPLGVRSGGYVLAHEAENTPADITLIATGSEVQLALAVREKLAPQGIKARVVSLPCWNLFDAQPVEYREAVLPPAVPMLAIEAGVSLGWRPYIGPGIAVIGVDRFGASAPGNVVMSEYGFSVDHVTQQAIAKVRSKMNKNPLLELEAFGQSVWLDYLRRNALDNGEIQRLIDQDGVSGLTSNPAIFEKAIAGSHDYDNAIRAMVLPGKSLEEIYETLTIDDIQRAADLFRPIYDQREGGDGFVSLEVSPKLAHDTAGTIAEARHLWTAVNRPNLLIKVPGTREGLPAIQQLIGAGINVNITLLFGLPRYREVAEAYLAGLETLAAQGKPLTRIASVASFFLSRIDVLIDPMLEKLRLEGGPIAENVARLHGQVAIASAKVAYQIYQEIFGGERFQKLSYQGARTQRLLWASTGTKNPEYSDVKYVESLIGRNTINTIPLETLAAYREHGKPASQLEEDTQEAYRVLEGLRQAGVDLDAATQKLEDEGVMKFSQAFEQLMAALQEKQVASSQEPVKP